MLGFGYNLASTDDFNDWEEHNKLMFILSQYLYNFGTNSKQQSIIDSDDSKFQRAGKSYQQINISNNNSANTPIIGTVPVCSDASERSFTCPTYRKTPSNQVLQLVISITSGLVNKLLLPDSWH